GRSAASREALRSQRQGPWRPAPPAPRSSVLCPQVVDQRWATPPGQLVACAEMIPQALIALEPPERGLREHEMGGAFRPERLEVSNRLRAIGRIVARIGSVVGAREVPGAPIGEREEPVVTACHHEQQRIARSRGFDGPPDVGDEPQVLRLRDQAAWLPGTGRAPRSHSRLAVAPVPAPDHRGPSDLGEDAAPLLVPGGPELLGLRWNRVLSGTGEGRATPGACGANVVAQAEEAMERRQDPQRAGEDV